MLEFSNYTSLTLPKENDFLYANHDWLLGVYHLQFYYEGAIILILELKKLKIKNFPQIMQRLCYGAHIQPEDCPSLR